MTQAPYSPRDALRRRIESEFERRIASGTLPYEGRWLARDAIERAVAERERAGRRRLAELALLFGVSALFGLALLALAVAIGR
jgi:hypothetical protein